MSMRVGVIGLGGIARKGYLPLLTSWEGVDLLLCSRNPAAVEALKAQYRVARGAASLDELLRWGPEAVFVLTPSPTHYEIVEKLLAAGIDVFVEKPATMHSHETRLLAELADRQGKILMVGFNRRYAPLHRQARQLWGDRPVGMAVLHKHRSSAYHPSLYNNYIDDTVHIIDMLRFFCGDVEAVSTVYQMSRDKLTGAASTVALPGGGYGMVLTSLQAGRWNEQYEIHGGGASIYIEAFSRLTLVTEQEQQVWEETYASSWKSTLEGRGFAGEITHFFECVQTRQQPHTSGWEALKTQLLLEAMLACAKR
jgi:virulence factor